MTAIRLPPVPSRAAETEFLDLDGVTEIFTNHVPFILSNNVVGGEQDGLWLKSFHKTDPAFAARIGGTGLGAGPITGQLAWEITRQVGLGAPLRRAILPESGT